MNALGIIAEVINQGGEIRVAGDKLKLTAPGPLPDDLMALIRAHKSEIITALESEPSPVSPVVPGKKVEPGEKTGTKEAKAKRTGNKRAPLWRLLIDACHGLDITPQEVYRALSDDDFKAITAGRMAVETLQAFAADLIHQREAREAAAEDAEERAAILEHDGGLSRIQAEEVAKLAEAFYSHLWGTGKQTGCCHAPAGRYCPEGERLKTIYYGACS